MNERELRQVLGLKTPPNLRAEALKNAYEFHVQSADSKHSHQQECVTHIIMDAGERQRLGLYLASQISDEQDGNGQSALTIPGLQIQEERLTHWAQPRVEKLREMLFGKTTAPFSSYAEAIKWIEEVAEHQRQPSEADWYAAHELQREIHERIQKWQRLIRGRVSQPCAEINTRTRIITYHKPPAPSVAGKAAPYAKWVPAFVDVFIDPDYDFKDSTMPLLQPNCSLGETAPLQLLEMVAHDIAQTTGFSKPGVIFHALADLPLILPLARFRVEQQNVIYTDSDVIMPGWATITLYTPDISVRDLQEICSGLRKQWQVAKTKRLNDDHYRLLEAVENAGGPPPPRGKGTVAFWTEVKSALGEDEVSWRAIQKRYERLVQKLRPTPI